MFNWPIIIETKLNKWAAGNVSSENKLSKIVGALIRLSSNDSVFFNFQTEKQIHLPSFDGVVLSSKNALNGNIPCGQSFWELSVDKNIRAKAEEDFCKRNNTVSIDFAKDKEYVFVTPINWPKAQVWATEKNKDPKTKWKNVRAYAAKELSNWIDSELFGKELFFKIIEEPYSGALKSYLSVFEEYSRKSFSNERLLPAELIIDRKMDRFKEIIKKCMAEESKGSILKYVVTSKIEAFHFFSSGISFDDGISDLEKNRFVFVDGFEISYEEIILKKDNILILYNYIPVEIEKYQEATGFTILLFSDGDKFCDIPKSGEIYPLSNKGLTDLLIFFGIKEDDMIKKIIEEQCNYENIRKNIIGR